MMKKRVYWMLAAALLMMAVPRDVWAQQNRGGGQNAQQRGPGRFTFGGLLERYDVVPGVAHWPNPLYDGLGEDNWAFYRDAFSEATPAS